MLQVPEIRAPDEEADEDDKTSSSGPPSLSSPAISVPAVSLHVPSDDSSPAGEDPCVTLQVPCMGDLAPGRLEPPRSLHLSLPPFPQPSIPSLLQVPGFHGPRRRHSWICGYVGMLRRHEQTQLACYTIGSAVVSKQTNLIAKHVYSIECNSCE